VIAVLDMARHIPLYRAVLQLLRAMALSPQLVSLLLPQDRRHKSAHGDELSVVCLLTKMKNCVDTYASRLKYVDMTSLLPLALQSFMDLGWPR
jgi:baculoviral IAP repeat-containing protein 6